MYRVTNSKLGTSENEILYVQDGVVKYGYDRCMTICPIECIEKVEKKARYLTLEEIKELGLRVGEIYNSYNHSTEFYLYHRKNEYGINDYVDITLLIKGENLYVQEN